MNDAVEGYRIRHHSTSATRTYPSVIVITASKQNRKQRPDVLIADACHPEPALKDVFDTDLLHSARLFSVHLNTADAFANKKAAYGILSRMLPFD